MDTYSENNPIDTSPKEDGGDKHFKCEEEMTEVADEMRSPNLQWIANSFENPVPVN